MKDQLVFIISGLLKLMYPSNAVKKSLDDNMLHTIQAYTATPKQEIEAFIKKTNVDPFMLQRYVTRYCQLPDAETITAMNGVGLGILEHFELKHYKSIAQHSAAIN